MILYIFIIFCCVILGFFVFMMEEGYVQFFCDVVNNWYQWRGLEVNGVFWIVEFLLCWSEDENFCWKVVIDGMGILLLIVWEDQVFVLMVIDIGEVDFLFLILED